MVISSSQNPKIKDLKKLMTSKSLVFFDNPKLVEEAYLSGHQIKYIIVREDYVGKTDYGGEVITVSDNVFKVFSSTENSQGLIGVTNFKYSTIEKPQGNFLVLDNLQDPGNLGTLIRSCLGANFLDLYLINCVKPTNDKVIRSSMGAIFKTRICLCTQEEFEKNFISWHLPLISCDMNGENLYETKFPNQVGIVVGNEGNGVSNQIKKLSTSIVKIPMQNGLESLNAGVSGSIVMYEIANKK